MQVPSPTGPPDDPLVPANLGGWFSRIGGVIRRSFVPLLCIQIGVVILEIIFFLIIAGVLVALLSTGIRTLPAAWIVGFVLFFVILLIVNALAQAASIFVMIKDAAGEPTTLRTALRFATRRMLPLVGWWIVGAVMIAFVLLLLVVSSAIFMRSSVAGYVLFLIPGFYLAIVFIATLSGVVVVEHAGIDRCFILVTRRFWRTAGRLILVGLIFIAFGATMFFLQNLAGSDSIISNILQWIFNLVIQIGVIAVSMVTYAELRFHENPGVLTPTLATELRP